MKNDYCVITDRRPLIEYESLNKLRKTNAKAASLIADRPGEFPGWLKTEKSL